VDIATNLEAGVGGLPLCLDERRSTNHPYFEPATLAVRVMIT